LRTKTFRNKRVLWLAAASLCAIAILVGIDLSAHVGSQPRQIASALLLAVLIVAVVRLATNAMAARESNVLEHAPEMSSLSFPPSSLRR